MKYKITDQGYDEFITNKRKYLAPSIESKIMQMLSTRVGYTLDSIRSQVLLDPAVRASDGRVIGMVNTLKDRGYIEVIEL